jgi:peptide/nickel transport system ATP-binding protein
MADTSAPIVRVENLKVDFPGIGRGFQAVRGVSFTLGKEKLGIVGESGSGKSLTGRALLKLVPPKARLTADRLEVAGRDLLTASEPEMIRFRGSKAAMILQDPTYSLNPLMRVGPQIAEAYRLHRKASAAEARERALAMLEAVQIREPAKVYNLYPHEVSGGMGQRIMIAMMLIPEPSVIIADEPTSALDVTVRRHVLSVLEEILDRVGASLIFISHDLNLVGRFCDRVLVMYSGRIVEDIRGSDLHHARHPYTQALLASLPRLDRPERLLAVPARSPDWLTGPIYRNGVEL